MIVGVVTDLQARVEIVLRLADRDDQAIECVVDTGFQGELALPPARLLPASVTHCSSQGSRSALSAHE